MCHGFKGSSTGPARGFVNFSRMLIQLGYSVLRFDQPNCGNSDGPFLDVSFNEWVETVVELTEKYTARGYRITLLGESMGASAAIVAANKDHIRGKVSALLLWSPDPVTSSSVDPVAIYEERGQKFRGRFWREAKEANVLACLRTFEGGIHLVHGGLGSVHTNSQIMLQSENGNHRSSVPTNCADPSRSAWQRQPVEPASTQRYPLCRRARLQMAGIAASIWQLAHRLHPDEPVVQERCARPGFRVSSTRAHSAYQDRSGFHGQYHSQGPSRWNRCVKKNGPQSIGKSRGGWTTKIHMVAADARTAVTFSLSPGQATMRRRGESC